MYARERISGRELRDWPGRSEWVIGLFRRPVVRTGDVVRPAAEPPRLAPFPPAESVAVQASPSPRKDAFSIGDNTRNMNREFDAASFPGT